MNTDYKTPTVPLVSVIVPNYNNGEWIRDCLDSILDQTYKNIEIIIADDCSFDNSPGIMREYEKKYPSKVRCVYHKKNNGVSYNRHSAILLSNGEYITTIDSDDYYYDTSKLEKEMELILKYKNNNNKNICSFSNTVFVKEDKTFISVRGTSERLKEGNLLEQFLMRSCEIPINFICLRSAYFDIGGYNKKLPIYEDWDLKIRIAANYDFYYTGINGTTYRRHGNGLSSAQAPRHITYLKKVFKKNIHLIPKTKRPEVEREFNNLISNMRKVYIKKVSQKIDENIKNNQIFYFLKNYCSLIKNDKSYINPEKLFKIISR